MTAALPDWLPEEIDTNGLWDEFLPGLRGLRSRLHAGDLVSAAWRSGGTTLSRR